MNKKITARDLGENDGRIQIGVKCNSANLIAEM